MKREHTQSKMNKDYNRLLFFFLLLFTFHSIGYAQRTYYNATTDRDMSFVLPKNAKTDERFSGNNYAFTATPDADGILYVNKDASTNGDGSSWENAIKELGDALLYAETASNGTVNEIWVSKGIYTPLYRIISTDPDDNPTTDRDMAFVLPKNVKIYGGFLGNETNINQRDLKRNKSVLSGDIGIAGNNSDNCYHVIIAAGDIENVVLDGFIIKDGNANGESMMIVNDEFVPQTSGGGIIDASYNATAHNVIYSNLEITSNQAQSGGGASVQGVHPAVFNKVTIKNNRAEMYGGGIHNTFSSIVVVNSLICENDARVSGGGIMMGSGLKRTLTNVTISKNTVGVYGSGIFLEGGAKPIMNNSIVWGNSGEDSRNIDGNTAESHYSLIQDNDFSDQEGSYDGTDVANDPMLNSDYTLNIASPYINKGNSSLYDSSVYGDTDLAYSKRIASTSIDLGAFELPFPEAKFITLNKENCLGEQTDLKIELSGSGIPYQIKYQINSNAIFETIDITNNTEIVNGIYTLKVSPTQTTKYTLVSIKDNTGKENPNLTSTVTVTIRNKPAVGHLTAPSTTCSGNLLSVTKPALSAAGSSIIAEGWTLNDLPFNPSTDVVGLDDNGKKLAYWVTNSCGTAKSNEVTIAVSNQGLKVQDIGIGCNTVADLNKAIVSTAQGTTVAFYRKASDTQPIQNPSAVVVSNNQSTTFYAKALGGNSSCVTHEMLSFKVTPTKTTQKITFDVISPKQIGTPDFDPMATASSGLAITYTSSNPEVATIVNGKIHIVGVGTTIITASQSGNECFLPAEDVSRELNVIDFETGEDLTPKVEIDGQPWADLSQAYVICESNITSVHINLTVPSGATVDKGLSFDVEITEIGMTVAQFTVSSKDGSRFETFYIYIDKRVAFESIVKMRWNNTFAAINNPSNNGGYDPFIAYKWFRNEEVVGTEQYYSVNNLAWEKLNPQDLYYLEVETEDGKSIRTCYWNGILDDFSVSAYPNPVQKGGVVYVEASMNEMAFTNANIELYTFSGTFISRTKVTGRTTEIPMNEAPGVYVLKFIGENDYVRSFKVIIKE